MAKRIKLTAKNYHTDKNTYLSNSKLGLFLKSKEAYHARYIAKTDKGESTPSMMLGRAVDLAFEKGRMSVIDKKFVVMTPKDYKESGEKRERITEDPMQRAKDISTKLLGSQMYKDLQKMKPIFQRVFTDEELGFAGMLDVMLIDESEKIIEIIDLKTSAPMAMKSKKSWFYTCLDSGYFRQLAGYKMLVQKYYPNYTIICKHVVVGSNDYYPVKIFYFDVGLIDREIPFIKLMIEQIKVEKEWKDYIPSWDEVILIQDPNEDDAE